MNDAVLVSGSPRFAAPHLKQLAATAGHAAAWTQACTENMLQAAQDVTGDFAVGLREPSGRTFLAVDRFAMQTLCYRMVGSELRFATRADALADASTEIDPQAIFDYLFFHAIPSPRTVFKGILRVPPAHCAVYDKGELRLSRYWNPEFSENRATSFPALQQEFLGLLRQSVGAQLDGSKPACFLSGGTDSSTVAGILGAASGQVASTYSIGFDAAGYDEMAFARLAARHFRTAHHEYYVTPDDLVRSIGTVATHYDQPFGNSSALPAYYCAAMAQADGVTRMLAGDGGDELFGGNTRYAKQRIFGWYGALPSGLRTRVMEPILGSDIASRLAPLRKPASYVEQGRVPMPDRLNLYNLLNRLGIANMLTPGFLSQVDIDAPPAQQRTVWEQPATQDALSRNLAFDWRYTLAENDLPKVRGTGRLAGVDVGFPLLDQRLVDFSLQLPARYKLKGLQLRWFFKEALRGFLPDEIIRKKKQGFGLPFGIWCLRHGALNRLATESLHGFGERGVVRREFIQTLLTQRLEQHPAYYGEMVWLLMMLEQWLRHHAADFYVPN